MTQMFVLVIIVAMIAVLAAKRSEATKERKAVSARIAQERQELGDYSPTAALFREAGVEFSQPEGATPADPAR